LTYFHLPTLLLRAEHEAGYISPDKIHTNVLDQAVEVTGCGRRPIQNETRPYLSVVDEKGIDKGGIFVAGL
jgi:hypothetical protein